MRLASLTIRTTLFAASLVVAGVDSARAEPAYVIDQNAVELTARPVCVSRKEAELYALVLQNWMVNHPNINIDDAINATSHRTAGHGGDEFACYVMAARPAYFDDPPDVVDVVDTFGAPIHPSGHRVFFARAEIIDGDGSILTRENIGDDLYAMSLKSGEITRRDR